MFLDDIWIKTMPPFFRQEDFPIEVPNFLYEPMGLFELNTHIDSIGRMYKKAIEITLFNEYNVNDISIPKYFIKYINENYTGKISINYDNNLDKLNGLIKLHGSFMESFIEYDGNIDIKDKDKEFVNFIKMKTLSWDMVLEKESKIKSRQLDILKQWKEDGISPTFRNFGVANDLIDSDNVKLINVKTYDELNKLCGEVHIIGISQINDEQIFRRLSENRNITKIIHYCDVKESNLDGNVLKEPYYKFWLNLEIDI